MRAIYLDPNEYKPETPYFIALLGRELVHYQQLQQMGGVEYLAGWSLTNKAFEKPAEGREKIIQSDMDLLWSAGHV